VNRNPDPRILALETLEALERRDAFADAVLNAVLSRNPSLSPRDRGLLSHLVYGVLRWRNRLDAHLAAATARPLQKVQPRLLQLLRLGAYQILFLDRVPDRAAVSESVELARRARMAHAAGFVNAVLRSVSTRGPDLPPVEDPAERVALEFGCPRWLVELWAAEHGQQGAEALCRAASRIPQLWLRVHAPRTTRPDALERLRRQGFSAEAGEFGPGRSNWSRQAMPWYKTRRPSWSRTS
jgi:16S rRNA (cytosine967-C5)-methyltransferase